MNISYAGDDPADRRANITPLAAAQVPVHKMTRADLIRRKAELEGILAVLTEHTMGCVCTELGEISYLLDGRADRSINPVADPPVMLGGTG